MQEGTGSLSKAQTRIENLRSHLEKDGQNVSGLDIIQYFYPDLNDDQQQQLLKRWLSSRLGPLSDSPQLNFSDHLAEKNINWEDLSNSQRMKEIKNFQILTQQNQMIDSSRYANLSLEERLESFRDFRYRQVADALKVTTLPAQAEHDQVASEPYQLFDWQESVVRNQENWHARASFEPVINLLNDFLAADIGTQDQENILYSQLVARIRKEKNFAARFWQYCENESSNAMVRQMFIETVNRMLDAPRNYPLGTQDLEQLHEVSKKLLVSAQASSNDNQAKQLVELQKRMKFKWIHVPGQGQYLLHESESQQAFQAMKEIEQTSDPDSLFDQYDAVMKRVGYSDSLKALLQAVIAARLSVLHKNGMSDEQDFRFKQLERARIINDRQGSEISTNAELTQDRISRILSGPISQDDMNTLLFHLRDVLEYRPTSFSQLVMSFELADGDTVMLVREQVEQLKMGIAHIIKLDNEADLLAERQRLRVDQVMSTQVVQILELIIFRRIDSLHGVKESIDLSRAEIEEIKKSAQQVAQEMQKESKRKEQLQQGRVMIASGTIQGSRHKENQDAFVTSKRKTNSAEQAIICMADGVSLPVGGKEAASLAVVLLDYVLKSQAVLTRRKIESINLAKAIVQVQDLINRYALLGDGNVDTGFNTMLQALFVEVEQSTRVQCANYGDQRVYQLITDPFEELRQLSRDPKSKREISNGQLVDRVHKVVGLNPPAEGIQPQALEIDLSKGPVLLCSDGLAKIRAFRERPEMLRRIILDNQANPLRAVQLILVIANKYEAPDDTTVTIITSRN